MANTLRRLFNLYAGEEKNAFLFATLAFIWSFGAFCGLTLSEGQFLENIGAQELPKAYLSVACTMFLVATIFILALNKISVRHLLLGVITIGSSLYLLFSIILLLTSAEYKQWFWFIFKVYGSIFVAATTTSFWSFVDQYYDLQDAKRLFCLFNSATFLGDACGGALISMGLETLGVSGIIIIICILLLTSFPLISLINKKVQPVMDESFEGIQIVEKRSFKTLFKSVLKSRFTLFMMFSYLILQLIAIVTEYNYMDTFDKVFTGTDLKDPSQINMQENQLTEFLGKCSAWVSFGNMLFGLFFYSRLVKKLGVNNIILISPFFFLALFVVWSFDDILTIAVIGLIAREGLIYSFDDNNFNLLMTGVPTKVKNQTRVAVDSFFEPSGMLISALLLFLLQNESKYLGLILSACALGIVLSVRHYYPKAIFQNLAENAIRFEKKAREWLIQLTKREKKEAEFRLFSFLKEIDEPTQLLAYESLLKLDDPRILPRMLNQVGRLSIPGKMKFIQLLSDSQFSRDNQVIDRLERWRRMIPHPGLKSAIHFYFAQHGLLHPDRVINDLNSIHIGIRGAAILTWRTSDQFSFNSDQMIHFAKASEELQNLLDSTFLDDIAMGLKILGLEGKNQNIERLIPFLKHSSVIVNRAAAKAVCNIACEESSYFAPELISHLTSTVDSEVRMYCLLSLGKIKDSATASQIITVSIHFRPNEKKTIERIIYNMGLKMVPILLSITKNTQIQDRPRLLAGKILGKLSLPQLKVNLSEIIQEEIDRAYFYYYHWFTIQKQTPEQDLSILENALKTGFFSVIDFVIQLLGIAGSIEDSELLSHSLRSKNQKVRGHALETLEKTCDSHIFSMINPLIDERSADERLRLYLREGRTPFNLTQLLNYLENSSSMVDRIVSITLKARLNIPHWEKALRKQMETDEEIFHHFAYELLET